MPGAVPLLSGTDPRARRQDNLRSYTYGPTPVRRSDLVRLFELQAERDALREMVKQAKAREMFFL